VCEGKDKRPGAHPPRDLLRLALGFQSCIPLANVLLRPIPLLEASLLALWPDLCSPPSACMIKLRKANAAVASSSYVRDRFWTLHGTHCTRISPLAIASHLLLSLMSTLAMIGYLIRPSERGPQELQRGESGVGCYHHENRSLPLSQNLWTRDRSARR
jgi:hypothetical protein